MEYNREILIETAQELKEAIEHANKIAAEARQKSKDKAGIIGYTGEFHVYNTDLFMQICKQEGKLPNHKERDYENYPHKYSIVIDDMIFFYLGEDELEFEVWHV